MDTEKGRHRHPLGLVYQRRLSLTQNTEPSESQPPVTVRGEGGEQKINPVYQTRVQSAPQEFIGPVPLGQVRPEPAANRLLIPFHPELRAEFQYQRPNYYSKDLIRSYAQHALSLPHPEHPDAVAKTVKVYRVRHEIMQPRAYATGMHPTDMTFYLPYYMGEFDTEGRMTREAQTDPLLYWLLPNLRDDRLHPENVRCHYLRHAGDRNWVQWPDKTWRAE
jgi:hypothetical protein